MRIAVSVCLMLFFAPPAIAADCRDEIVALFDDGGAMDPFARPPHRQTVYQYDANGQETRVGLNIFEDPLRTIAGVVAEGHFTMAIDADIWNGPTPEGPWTKLDYQMPADRGDAMRRATGQNAANIEDPECFGDEGGLTKYAFRTQTDPDETRGYFGAHYTVWIDPDPGRAMRIEMTDFVNSWTEGVSKERHDIRLEYDATIRVLPPEG